MPGHIQRAHVQGSIQLSVGVMLVSLVVVVRPLSYPFACLAPIMFAWLRLLLGLDHHVGTILRTCATFLGATLAAPCVAGVVASIAMAGQTPGARLAILCVLGALVIMPLTIGRPTASRVPGLWVMSMMSCVWYGSALILSVNITDVRTVWYQAVVWLMMSGIVSTVGATLVGLLLLPSSAAHELQEQTAGAIKLLGHHISECSAVIFSLAEDSDGGGGPGGGGVPGGVLGRSNKSSKIVHFMERSRSPPDSPTPDTLTAPNAAVVDATGLSRSSAKSSEGGMGRQLSSQLAGLMTWIAGVSGGGGQADREEDAALLLADEQVAAEDAARGGGNGDEEEDVPSALMLDVQEFLHQEPDDATFLELLRHATRPLWEQHALAPHDKHRQSLMLQLRMKLGRARDCVPPASSEPLLYSGMSLAALLGPYPALLAAAGTVVTRVSALAGMVAQAGHLLSHSDLDIVLPGELASHFKQVLAQLATSCANLAATLTVGAGSSTTTTARRRYGASPPRFLRNVEWALRRRELRDKMLDAVDGLWRNVEHSPASEPVHLISGVKIRSLMHTWTLIDGIMQGVDSLEGLVATIENDQLALLHPSSRPSTTTNAGGQPPRQVDPAADNNGDPVSPQLVPAPPPLSYPAASLPHSGPLGFVSIDIQSAAGSPAGTVLLPPPYWRWWLGRLPAHWAFVRTLLPLLLLVAMRAHIWQTFGPDLKVVLRSPAARSAALQDRLVQAAFKYYAIVAAALVAVILVSGLSTFFVSYIQIFMFITCCIVVFEKVETMLSRMLMRLSGALIGAALGFLAMHYTAVASSPWAVLLIVGGSMAIASPLADSKYRTVVVLTMYTMHAVILCQYTGVPGDRGQLKYYLERILAIGVGCIIPTVFAQLFLPWYVDEEALQQLSSCFQAAVSLLTSDYAAYYNYVATKSAIEGDVLDRNVSVTTATENAMVAFASAATAAAAGCAAAHPPLQLCPPMPGSVDSGAPPTSLAAVVGSLSAVQRSLAAETVVWHRGPLTTSPLVHKLLAAQLLLADRLAALELAVEHTHDSPVCFFDGWAFDHYVVPMHEQCLDVFTKLHELSAVAAAVILEGAASRASSTSHLTSQRPELLQRITALEAMRVQLHARTRHLRARSYISMKAAAALLAAVGAREVGRCTAELEKLAGAVIVSRVMAMRQQQQQDGGGASGGGGGAGGGAAAQRVSLGHIGRDSALFQSFLFALHKSLDATAIVARSLAAQPPLTNRWLSWLRS